MISRGLAREFWNGAWMILCIIMVAMLALFIWERWRRFRGSGLGWYEEPGIQTAIALAVFFLGSGIRATWVWMRLGCENDVRDHVGSGNPFSYLSECEWLYTTYLGYALELSAVLAIAGATCIVRVLSPRQWRPWSWISALVLAVALPPLLLT